MHASDYRRKPALGNPKAGELPLVLLPPELLSSWQSNVTTSTSTPTQ